jgi:hypothetical protein
VLQLWHKAKEIGSYAVEALICGVSTTMKIKNINLYHGLTIEADEDYLPDQMWLGQFFEGIDPMFIPILACFIEVDFEESYTEEPTTEEFLRTVDESPEALKSITFMGGSDMTWVYNYDAITRAYEIAKEDFQKHKRPEKEDKYFDKRMQEMYDKVKKFFDEH